MCASVERALRYNKGYITSNNNTNTKYRIQQQKINPIFRSWGCDIYSIRITHTQEF